ARPRGHGAGVHASRPRAAGPGSRRDPRPARAPPALSRDVPAVRIEDLDYDLPPERIAQRPAERREDARLLGVERSPPRVTDAPIPARPGWLQAGDALVVNETRVRPARLDVRRPSGGKVELLFVRPEPGSAADTWRVLARPARHAAPGARLETADGDLAL